MRILLDESLPHDLAALIAGHDVSTVRDEGWASVKNGQLLALAATKFEAFITADRNLEFQQNLAKLPIAVVVLVARKNRIQDLEPLLPELAALLNHLPAKALRKVGA
jgi:predicted nuclease of predicted toxin-antitoxin system